MTCQAELSPCPWKGRWCSLPPATLETLAPSASGNSFLSFLPLLLPVLAVFLERWIQKSFQKGRRALISLKSRLPLYLILLCVAKELCTTSGSVNTHWGVAGSIARFTVNTKEVQFPKHLLGPRSCHSIAPAVQITWSEAACRVFFPSLNDTARCTSFSGAAQHHSGSVHLACRATL